MLKEVRKPGRAKNITAYVVFGAICLVFVFFGIAPSNNMGGTGGAAAIVNKAPISFVSFREQFDRMQEQYKFQLQGNNAQRQQALGRMKKQALDMLINNEVIYQSASKVGVFTVDGEVIDSIVNIKAFQKDGRFEREYYDNYLKYRQMAAQTFEAEFKKDLVIDKMRGLLEKAIDIPQSLQPIHSMAEGSTYALEYAVIDAVELKDKAPISVAQEKAYLEKAENLKKAQEDYAQNESRYKTGEQVHAQHILIKFDETKKGSKEAALKKIKDIANRAQKEDFSKLANAVSEDPGSKAKGGDLGFFSRGAMVKSFEDYAFSGAIGKVSEPIESPFGYHLIKVLEKKPAVTKSFDQVKLQIAEEELRKEMTQNIYTDLSKILKEGKEKEVRSWLKGYGVHLIDVKKTSFSKNEAPSFNSWYDLFLKAKSSLDKLSPDEQMNRLKVLNQDLSQSNEEVLSKVLRAKKTGFLPELIESQGKKFILFLKEKNIAEASIKDAKEKMKNGNLEVKQRVQSIFTQWAEEQRKMANVEINPIVFQ